MSAALRRAWLACGLVIASGCGDNTPAAPDARPSDARNGTGKPPPPALGPMIDRMGRPITGRILIGGLLPDGPGKDQALDEYDRKSEFAWPTFEGEIARNLAIFDALDSRVSAGDGCGNVEWFAPPATPTSYAAMAKLFADDRLFVINTKGICTEYFALEYAVVRGLGALPGTCGGRAPSYDVIDATLSILIKGAAPPPISDGVDSHPDNSDSAFPFFGAPRQ
jgi:hypothetical protein